MKIVLILVGILFSVGLYSQNTITELQYWFDNDFTNKIVIPTGNVATFNLNSNVDVSMLNPGLHTINALAIDNNGKKSTIISAFFYKLPSDYSVSNPKIVQFQYWFDDDFASMFSDTASNTQQFNIATNIDVSTLSNGLHIANARFQDEAGKWSSILSSFFYKTPNNTIILKDIIAYEYWFNDDYANVTNLAIGPNQIENLDTFVVPENIGLGIGNHYFNPLGEIK